MILANNCYRLGRQLTGIRLEHPHSENGVASFLPDGSIISTTGPAQFFRMIEARWGNEFFAIFEEDLETWGELVDPPRRLAAGAGDGQPEESTTKYLH